MLRIYGSDLMIIPTSENDAFCNGVCDCLGVTANKIESMTFRDGDSYRRVADSARGKDVFMIQTYFGNPNDRKAELELLLDAINGSAERVNVVIPYHPYSRGDWKAKRGDPISARSFANGLVANGVKNIITMDVHSPQIAGFYPNTVGFNNLTATLLFGYHISRNHESKEEVVVTSPDVGYNTKVCQRLAEELQCTVAAVYKRRIGKDKTESKEVMGEVRDKDCILLDDETSTGGSLVGARALLIERGAKSVRGYVTHNKLTKEEDVQKIEASGLELVCTNTVHSSARDSPAIKTISVAPIFAEAIKCIHGGESTEKLFKYKYIVSVYDKIRSAGGGIRFLYE